MPHLCRFSYHEHWLCKPAEHKYVRMAYRACSPTLLQVIQRVNAISSDSKQARYCVGFESNVESSIINKPRLL